MSRNPGHALWKRNGIRDWAAIAAILFTATYRMQCNSMRVGLPHSPLSCRGALGNSLSPQCERLAGTDMRLLLFTLLLAGCGDDFTEGRYTFIRLSPDGQASGGNSSVLSPDSAIDAGQDTGSTEGSSGMAGGGMGGVGGPTTDGSILDSSDGMVQETSVPLTCPSEECSAFCSEMGQTVTCAAGWCDCF